MKNIRKFEMLTEKMEAIIEEYSVSYVNENDKVYTTPENGGQNESVKNYMRFVAVEDSQINLTTFNFDTGGADTSVDLKHSKDCLTWTQYDFNPIPLAAGETLYLKGNNENGFANERRVCTFGDFSIVIGIPSIPSTGKFECHGNIMSLLYGDEFEDKATIPSLGCFAYMFANSSGLTTAPELPATILESDCYSSMFDSCTSLIEAPELPATELAPFCYFHMFWGCTNLSKITMLATDISAQECLTMWTGMRDYETGEEVSGVAPTGVFVKDANMDNLPIGNQENRFSGIPEGWVIEDYKLINELTSLTITADDVSANQTRTKIYYTAVGNYRDENGVLVEENITVTGQTFSAPFPTNDSYTEDVVREISFTYLGVTATTTITQHAKVPYHELYLTLEVLEDAYVRFEQYSAPMSLRRELSAPYEYSYDGINWLPYDFGEIHVTSGQQISWKGYYENGYGRDMRFVVYEKDEYGYESNDANFIAYGNVMSLLYSDEFVNKNEIPDGCNLSNLFSGNSGLIDASNLTLPATTLADYCYYYMFNSCTSLKTAPELPATILTEGCYSNMFSYCTSLNHITMLATDISANWCLENWVDGVSPTGTFIKSCEAVTLPICSEGIPSGWTIENAFECEVVSLSITADNVEFYMTSTTIHYESVVNLYNKDGEVADTITLTGTTQSEPFPENTSETDIVERTISFTFYDKTATTTITQGKIIPYYTDYTTFEALEDGTFSFKKKGSGDDIQYSKDNGTTWTPLAYGENVSVVAGDKVMWKSTITSGFGIGEFSSSNKFNAYGNTMSLLYGDDFSGQISLEGESYVFNYLFNECSYLIDASNLILPATTLAHHCYSFMFSGCTSLTTAPELPATTLDECCYQYMFEGCTNLTTAPSILPATALAEYCYQYMFGGCTSLTTAPELPATTLAGSCYVYMFSGCTSLTTAPSILPATTLADYCCRFMFSGCTSLTTAPELPATTLKYQCYYYMFDGCTSLTTAPELPATTLDDYCYYGMFNDCTSLITAPELPATTLEEHCYQSMFQGCTSLTTAPELPAMTLATRCYEGMFSGCTSLKTAPELPATILTNGCYYNMFRECTNLTTAPELPATTLAIYCYECMFSNCTSLNHITMLATNISEYSCLDNWVDGVSLTGTFVKHFDMTSLPTGGSGIPEGWEVKNHITPTECTNLTITAEDVIGNDTTTTIHYTATYNAIDYKGNTVTGIVKEGTTISAEFPQNTSETETVERTITFEFMGVTASTTITQGVWVNYSYTVDLNNQWELSSTISNPDSTLYDGVYQSFSNKGVNNSSALMYIDIFGYSSFKFYVRSNAESNYDYVVVSNLDSTLTSGTTSGTAVKMTTKGNQNSGTSIDSYQLVEFTGIDGGAHRITVMFIKDSSQNANDDRGYVLIPKKQ